MAAPRSVSSRLASSLGGTIPGNEIIRVGGCVAVHPKHAAAVAALAVGQPVFSQWLSRQYRATVKMFNSTTSEFVTVFHRGDLDGNVDFLAMRRSSVISKEVSILEKLVDTYIHGWSGNLQFTAMCYQNITGNGATPPPPWCEFDRTRSHISARYQARQFDTITFGPSTHWNVNSSHFAVQGNRGTPGSVCTQPYPVQSAVLAPAGVHPVTTSPVKDWILIEGPAVFTHGEVYSTYRGLTFFCVSNAHTADALEGRLAEVTDRNEATRISAKIATLREQPEMVSVRFSADSTLNRWLLVDEAVGMEDLLVACTDVQEGVDMGAVNTALIAPVAYGVYSPVAALNPIAEDTAAIKAVVDSVAQDVITVSVLVGLAGCSSAQTGASQWPVDRASCSAICRALSLRGKHVTATSASGPFNEEVDAFVFAITKQSQLIEARLAAAEVSDVLGQSASSIGAALVAGAVKPLSASTRTVLDLLLKPNFAAEQMML